MFNVRSIMSYAKPSPKIHFKFISIPCNRIIQPIMPDIHTTTLWSFLTGNESRLHSSRKCTSFSACISIFCYSGARARQRKSQKPRDSWCCRKCIFDHIFWQFLPWQPGWFSVVGLWFYSCGRSAPWTSYLVQPELFQPWRQTKREWGRSSTSSIVDWKQAKTVVPGNMADWP